MGDETESDLMLRRKAFMSRSLVRLSEHYRNKANDEIRRRGFPDFANPHMQVLFNLEMEGNRITTLADRARISVQAMGKLVKDLEAKGYVERRPDPTDGRAQIIALTRKGEDFFALAVDVIDENEAEMAAIIGAESFDRLKSDLQAIVDEVDPIGF